MSEIASLLAMYPDTYFSIEPLIDVEWNIRLQKVGNYSRAYRRKYNDWKGQEGEVTQNSVELLDLTKYERYTLWIQECSKLFGGLDLLEIDILQDKQGKEYILEMGDTATGFAPWWEEEDNEHLKDLLLQKMQSIRTPQK